MAKKSSASTGARGADPKTSQVSAKAKGGRPSTFSQAIATEICERLAGGESLNAMCQHAGMPDHATVFRWLSRPENSEFRENYARAREFWAEAELDNLMHIADTPMVGEKVKIDADGNEEITRGDMIEHRRLQVEARKWALSKLAPKKYGEKLQQEISAPGGGPVNVTVRFE